MENRSKKATVLIYTLFLLNIALILGLVVFNVAWILMDSTTYYSTVRKLSNNILYKSNIALKYDTAVNSNGTGYSDFTSCPPNVTMSGNTVVSTTVYTTMKYAAGRFYCEGVFTGAVWWPSPVQIYYNDVNFMFTWATFKGNTIWVTSWYSTAVGNTSFWDSNNTQISFSLLWLENRDRLDDNFNSDNYKTNSTGTTNYPWNYADDDVEGRKIIYFYIPMWAWYVNVFWNSPTVTATIANNPNNTDTFYKKIGIVSNARVFLDIDHPYGFQLVRFDKARYVASKELVANQILTSSSPTGRIWFVQSDGTISTNNMTPTGSEYAFDFVNEMYGLFLANQGNGTLLFNLKAYTSTGAGIYITPIEDSATNLIKYSGTDILIDNESKYIGNEFEVVALKTVITFSGSAWPSCTYGLGLFGYCSF